jgi:hypothetical protein
MTTCDKNVEMQSPAMPPRCCDRVCRTMAHSAPDEGAWPSRCASRGRKAPHEDVCRACFPCRDAVARRFMRRSNAKTRRAYICCFRCKYRLRRGRSRRQRNAAASRSLLPSLVLSLLPSLVLSLLPSLVRPLADSAFIDYTRCTKRVSEDNN